MEQVNLSQIPFATPEIAESWKRGCEKDALKRQQRQKRFMPKWMDIWTEIDEHPGISWRQLKGIFSKHSLTALNWLVEKGLVQRIENPDYHGRGRKPTRYFPLLKPFVTFAAKSVQHRDGRAQFFGKWVSRKSKQKPEQTYIVKKRLGFRCSPSSLPTDYDFTRIFKKPIPKRFVRLYPEEKKKFDRYLAQNSLVLARRKGKTKLIQVHRGEEH